MVFTQTNQVPPCVLHEDEHLLVVNKPAGWNTHAPSPYAGEGIYEWVKHREPRWANLAIIHRLDKETSGVLVFGKTPIANRSLTEQFAGREVRKKYLLLTDCEPKQRKFTAKSKIIRAGDRYVSGVHGEEAETRFQIINPKSEIRNQSEPTHVGCYEIVAEPLTGRTHQIRVHAAENGFPILGDTLYGGAAFNRVCLHAAEIVFKHPASGEEVKFTAPVDFSADARFALRTAIIDPKETDSFRIIHGASDGWPGWFVEQLGEFQLSQSEAALTDAQRSHLTSRPSPIAHRLYHKILSRHVRRTTAAETSPQLVSGDAAPERFVIRENGVKFEMSFSEGYSVGLFLDQRDNRRRFLTSHVAADFSLFNSGDRSACGQSLTRPSATLPMNRPTPSPSEEGSTAGRVRKSVPLLGGVRGGFRGSMRELLVGGILSPSDPPCSRTVAAGGKRDGVRGFPLLQSEIGNRKSEILNTFAYTCGFSVCAALGGARTTSLDLSKKYLEWGKRNFVLNGLDPAQHDFIYGDTFDWMRRLAKKTRAFDVIVLDPPTFSQSKESGVFRAEKDYGKLVTAALPLLKPGGVLLASTNAAELLPERFLGQINEAIHVASRKILQRHYVPQPPDFPISRSEPAYLKTVWLQIA